MNRKARPGAGIRRTKQKGDAMERKDTKNIEGWRFERTGHMTLKKDGQASYSDGRTDILIAYHGKGYAACLEEKSLDAGAITLTVQRAPYGLDYELGWDAEKEKHKVRAAMHALFPSLADKDTVDYIQKIMANASGTLSRLEALLTELFPPQCMSGYMLNMLG